MKQGLLLLGCLVAAAGCKQAPPTQMETGYEVMTVSPTDRMISSAYSATIRGRQDIDIYGAFKQKQLFGVYSNNCFCTLVF